MISKEDVLKLRESYPDAAIVAYINTNAEVKSVVDICCTSSNALRVVNSLKNKKIIFIPDKNLANWIASQTDKEIIPYDGFCYVHQRFNSDEIIAARKLHPDAQILVHPEAPPEVSEKADFVLSTSGILNHAKQSSYKKFVIGTESGIIYRLKKENPDKEFYSLGNPKICFNMKKTYLTDIYNSLAFNQFEIILSDEIIKKAKHSIERMIKI